MRFENNATRIVYEDIISNTDADHSYTTGMLMRLTEVRLLSSTDDELIDRCIEDFISTVNFNNIKDIIHGEK